MWFWLWYDWRMFTWHTLGLSEHCCWPCDGVHVHHVTKQKSLESGFINISANSMFLSGFLSPSNTLLFCYPFSNFYWFCTHSWHTHTHTEHYITPCWSPSKPMALFAGRLAARVQLREEFSTKSFNKTESQCQVGPHFSHHAFEIHHDLTCVCIIAPHFPTTLNLFLASKVGRWMFKKLVGLKG